MCVPTEITSHYIIIHTTSRGCRKPIIFIASDVTAAATTAMTVTMMIQSRPRLIMAFRPAQCRVYNNIIISRASGGDDADVSHNIHRATVHLLRVVVVVAEEESTAGRGERSYGESFRGFCL